MKSFKNIINILILILSFSALANAPTVTEADCENSHTISQFYDNNYQAGEQNVPDPITYRNDALASINQSCEQLAAAAAGTGTQTTGTGTGTQTTGTGTQTTGTGSGTTDPGSQTSAPAGTTSGINTDLTSYNQGEDPLRLDQDKKHFIPAKDSGQSNRRDTYLHAAVPTICEQESSKPWNEVVSSGSADHMLGSLSYLQKEIVAKRFLDDQGREKVFNANVNSQGQQGGQQQGSLLADLDNPQESDYQNAQYIVGGSQGARSTGMEDIKTRIKSYVETAFICASIGSFTGHSAYDGSGGSNNSHPTDVYAQCNQSGNPQQCMASTQQSMSGFQCNKQKDETQDYLACKRLEKALTGFYIGQQLHQATQVFRVQDQSMNEQLRMQQQMNSGEGFSNKDAMITQRNGLQQQQNMATERAAFSGAEAATVGAIASSMPTEESLKRECLSNSGNLNVLREKVREIIDMNEFNAEAKTAIEEALPAYAIENNESSVNSLCDLATGYSNRQLILNGQARARAQQEMARAGVQAATDLAQAAMIGNMIDRLDQAIADWEEPESPNFEEVQLSDTVVSECLVDPSLPMCAGLQGSQRHGFTAGGININTGGPNTLGSLNTDDDGDGSAATRKSTSTNERQAIPGSIGSVGKDNSVANEFVDGPIAAGTVGKGSFRNGGGGGGAGGGSASQPGGAGGRGPAAAGGKGASAGRGVKVKFNGSGLGSVRARGGKGAGGARKEKGNPFANLAKKGKGGKSIRFRGPSSQVGGEKGNIWSMLSQRYGAIIKNDRLMKYEVK